MAGKTDQGLARAGLPLLLVVMPLRAGGWMDVRVGGLVTHLWDLLRETHTRSSSHPLMKCGKPNERIVILNTQAKRLA